MADRRLMRDRAGKVLGAQKTHGCRWGCGATTSRNRRFRDDQKNKRKSLTKIEKSDTMCVVLKVHFNTGDWSNGMIGVSKTFGGSSILSSPVKPNSFNIIYGPLVKRLRRRPLTAETGVRFPYGLLSRTLRAHRYELSTFSLFYGKINTAFRLSL